MSGRELKDLPHETLVRVVRGLYAMLQHNQRIIDELEEGDVIQAGKKKTVTSKAVAVPEIYSILKKLVPDLSVFQPTYAFVYLLYPTNEPEILEGPFEFVQNAQALK